MTTRERIHGLMEGIAAGNLLGIVQEGWSKERIAEHHPYGLWEILAKGGYPDDDDLAQAIIIAEEAVKGPLAVHALGKRFWEWGEENGLGMGGLTSSVLTLYGGDYPRRARTWLPAAGKVRKPRGLPIIEASKKAWQSRHAGNGALMRCAPLAARWVGDVDTLVRESIVSAVPTHWDRRCGWSCVIVNLASAQALRDGDALSPDALLHMAKDGVRNALPVLARYDYATEPPPSLVEAIETAWESRLSDIRFDGGNRGFTLLTLQAALISYWRAEDFESGLAEVIEAGGDTDTNGAVAGAVLGAKFGANSIPERWRARIEEIRHDRIPMRQHAQALAAAAGLDGH